MDESIQIGARIPRGLSNELVKIAEEQGLKVSDIVRDALKSYVEAIRSHRCLQCDTVNDPDAKYCKLCGKGLRVEKQDRIEEVIEKIKADPEILKDILLAWSADKRN